MRVGNAWIIALRCCLARSSHSVLWLISPKDFLALATQENIISIIIKIKVVTVDYLIGLRPLAKQTAKGSIPIDTRNLTFGADFWLSWLSLPRLSVTRCV